METSRNQNYLHGAAILTAAVLIVKVLGALYKIPMSMILDDEGFTHFSVAYNLYGVLLALSTAGLPIALAKIVSEANSLRRAAQVRKTFSVAMIAFVVLGTAGSVAMFVFPTELAVFMEDVEASQSIWALAPSVLLVCVMSAFRGYTQGLSDMRPTAISQVIEVAVKVAFGIALLLVFQSQGKSSPIMSAGAISGVAVGSVIACIYMGVVAIRRMKLEGLRIYDAPPDETVEKGSAVLKRLVKIGIPIALGSCVIAVITLVNTKIILGRLQFDGHFTYKEAKDLFGVYSKALTLYNFPAAIITPLTISVVPAIAGFLAVKKHSEAKGVVESSLRISSIIVLPMAVGLSVMSTPIMNGLYSNSSSEGGALLAIMGAASFFVCLALMTTAILQAAGRERLPMITMLVGGALNIAINYYLVAKAEVNIFGAPLGTLISYVVMGGLNLIFIATTLPDKPSFSRAFLRPLANSAIMGLAAWLVYPAVLQIIGAGPTPSVTMTLIALVAAVGIAAVVYLILTIVTKAITIEDMKLIPKGEKLAKLLRIK